MKFTLAVAQIDTVLGDVAKNQKKHVDVTRRAKEGGADLVVFPELSLSGYSIRDSNWDVALRPNDQTFLSGLLRESKDISIILGVVEESREFGIFNSALLLEQGKAAVVHRKTYPPTYGMFEELRYFSPGSETKAFDSKLGRFGVLICEDFWHLPLPYLLAQDGAQVIIAIAASPTRLAGQESMEIARINSDQHRSYARLLSSYVVFSNRVGFEDGVNFWGGSEIVGPGGDVLVRGKFFEEDLIFADIDENELRRARRLSRHFLDDDPRLVQAELERIIRGRFPS
ncbi:MAG TPA: nitrilase-related carbon-nitrogen hydrolase [Bacteroidota bacterium]|nr:nitrilase-related carbon-nitrogen hydrolase [Bacteroidota bacterium]